jgi:hypothetical protein
LPGSCHKNYSAKPRPAWLSTWWASRSSFEKCSALETASERNACYEKLRDDYQSRPQKERTFPRAKLFAPPALTAANPLPPRASGPAQHPA